MFNSSSFEYVDSAEKLLSVVGKVKTRAEVPEEVVEPYALYLGGKKDNIKKKLLKALSGRYSYLSSFWGAIMSDYFYLLKKLLEDRDKVQRVKQNLKASKPMDEKIARAQARAERFLHDKAVIRGKVYSWVSPYTDAFNGNDRDTGEMAAAVNFYKLEGVKDLSQLITHEMHHLGIKYLRQFYSDEVKRLMENDPPWYGGLSSMMGEGMATHAAGQDVGKVTKKILVKTDKMLYRVLTKKLSKDDLREIEKDFYEHNGPLYTVGNFMCRQLAEKRGLDFLKELQLKGPVDFFLEYNKIGAYKFKSESYLVKKIS